MVIVTIGVDVGKKRDPTAVCVAEREWREVEGRVEVHFVVRHLKRVLLGTPYPGVGERIGRVTDHVQARSGERPTVYVDATGVGQPVVALPRERVRSGVVVPVTFTAEDRRTDRRVNRSMGPPRRFPPGIAPIGERRYASTLPGSQREKGAWPSNNLPLGRGAKSVLQRLGRSR